MFTRIVNFLTGRERSRIVDDEPEGFCDIHMENVPCPECTVEDMKIHIKEA